MAVAIVALCTTANAQITISKTVDLNSTAQADSADVVAMNQLLKKYGNIAPYGSDINAELDTIAGKTVEVIQLDNVTSRKNGGATTQYVIKYTLGGREKIIITTENPTKKLDAAIARTSGCGCFSVKMGDDDGSDADPTLLEWMLLQLHQRSVQHVWTPFFVYKKSVVVYVGNIICRWCFNCWICFMPRIILSIIIIIAIVTWVVFLQMQHKKEITDYSPAVRDGVKSQITDKKSYVSAAVLMQGVEKLAIKHEKITDLKDAIHEQIVGMEWFINAIIITLLAGGHALVEWVPWLAKTKTIHTFADLLWLDFWRIQFTPDMLPSDVTGVDVFNPATRTFETSIGPIMTNILLADEINRTTPKVQAALLESMQERQVTIWWKTVKLPHPFFVLATQNPLEQEGTYPLPEAQIDRFLCKIMVDYPNLEQEKEMLDKTADYRLQTTNTKRKSIISGKELLAMQAEVAGIDVPSSIKDYIARIVQETRAGYSTILYGASPRGSISLMQAAQAVAYVQGHQKVSMHDVHMVILLTLRHRIILNYEAKLQNKNEDTILSEIVQYLPLS